jgi:hypothetical protein
MAYANNNEPLMSVFDAIGINDKAIENLVPQLSPQFQRPVLSKILDQIEGGTQKIKSKNRLFRIYRQENDYPYATIQSTVSIGGALQITLNETEFAAIAEGNAVYAQSGAIGKVVAKQPGKITVTFVANPSGATSFNTAVDFVASEGVIDGGDIGSLINRTTKETIFSLPDESKNIIGTMNASAYITFEDVNTYGYLKNVNGTQYYALQKEVQAIQRLNQQYVKRQLSNTPPVFSGSEPIGASLLNQILTMGGTAVPLASTATFTEDDLINTIQTYTAAGGFTSDEILVMGGPDYIANWQKALKGYLTTAGKNNTLGGDSISGINIFEYGFQGLNFKVVADPVLGNQRMWGTASNGRSARSNSAIWMNTAPVKTEQNVTMPFATSRYFGNNADIQRWIVPGSMDEKGNPVKQGANGKKGCQIEFTWDKQDQLSNPRACLYHGA